VPWLAHAGLAVSVGLGACANALLLYRGLRRAGLYQPQPGWAGFLLRLALALALLAATLVAANALIDWRALATAWALRAALLAAAIAAAMAVYFVALWALGFRPRDFTLRG
jgi:putative peptidoglycan lipid II flippase